MSSPAIDPSAIFQDPSQMAALQGGQDAPGAEPQEPPAGEQNPGEQEPAPQAPPIDMEGSIAHAIEVGCEFAIAAQSADDFMRFSQGVNFLAGAMKDLQPAPQPMDPALASLAGTAMKTDQQHAATMIQAAKDLHAAQTQHQRQMVDAAQPPPEPAPGQPNRPTSSQPSGRG